MRARENIHLQKPLRQPSILSCQVSQDKLTVQLDDGREVGISITLLNKWMFGGENIQPKQLAKYELWNEGKNVYFPEIDEILPARIFARGLFSSCED